MPEFVMLVGIPCSGKSNYVNKLKKNSFWEDAVVLSTDNYIEKQAQKMGMTYTQVFNDVIGDATKELEMELKRAIYHNSNIILDQTNLTIKSRRKKLSKIPTYYIKTAVYFKISLEEALNRNENRKGKYIPKSVIKQMYNQFVIPTIEEGFAFLEVCNK